MRKMRKVIGLISFIIIILSGLTVYADDTETENKIQANQNQIVSLQNDIKTLENQKNDKSKEIVKLNSNLTELKSNIDNLEAEIQNNSLILAQAEAESKQSYENFSNRLVAMYEQGSNAYLSLMIGAEDFSDLIERLYYISEISSYDKSVYDKYKENVNTINSKQQELTTAKAELERSTETFNFQLSSKNSELNQLVSAINQKKSEITKLTSENDTLSSSLKSTNFADALFAEAEKYIGMPYVFGGSTPETSFDCSGFVCYATTKSGVYNLPRTTAQGIYNQCIKISPSEAKRGDIIFFQGTYNAGETVTHVGFYAGDNKMLHCGNPIQYTSITTSYWQSHFYAFGRLKN